MLEEEGIVSKDDGYQGIITSVAKDICNRNKYRQIQIKVSILLLYNYIILIILGIIFRNY